MPLIRINHLIKVLHTSSNNNFTKIRANRQMSGEQEFQVLVSSQDYLKLQARCQELSSHQQKLQKENKQLSLKIIQLKQQNTNHVKNSASMADNIKFLSQKGLEMAKTLMNFETEVNELKVAMVQKQLQQTNKYKSALLAYQELQGKSNQLLKQNKEVKEILSQKQKILGVQKISRHTQVSVNYNTVQILTSLTMGEIDGLHQKTKQHEQKNVSYEKTMNELKNSIKTYESNISTLKSELQKLKKQLDTQSQSCDQLMNKLSSGDKITLQLNLQIKQLQSKLQKLACQKKLLQEQKEEIRANGLVKQQTYQSQLDILKSQLQVHSQEKCWLKQQLSTQLENISICRSEIENIKQKLIDNQQQLIQQKCKRAQLQQKEQQILQKNRSYEKDITQLESTKKQLQKNIIQLRNQQSQSLISTKKQLQDVNENYHKCQQEIQDKNKKITQMAYQFTQIEQMLKEEHVQKTKTIQFSKNQSLQLEAVKSKMKELIKCLQDEKKKMQHFQNMKQQLMSTKLKEQKLLKQIKNKDSEFNNLKVQMQKSDRQTLQSHKKEQELFQEAILSMQKDADQQQMRQRKLMQQINQLKIQLIRFKQSLESMNLQCETLKQKVLITQARLEESKMQQKNMEKQILMLNSQLETSRKNTQALSVMLEQSKQTKQKIQVYEKMNKEQQESIKRLQGTKIDLEHSFLQRIQMMRIQVQKVKNEKATMEKEYDNIIEGLQAEKKALAKSSKSAVKGQTSQDKVKQIKKFIEEYFIQLGCNLSQSKLEQGDIMFIIGEESKALIQAVNQAIAPFKKQKKLMNCKSMN